MRLLLPISASLLLAWQTVCAQSAEDYFNGGAHAYITNNVPEALKSVETGLKQYPDDEKLKKLYELLKQQSQQQSQQNQNQQSQQNQSQQQQSQKNQQNQQNQQQQQQPSQQNQTAQKQSGQKSTGQQNQQKPQPSNENQGGQKQENQNEPGQPVAAGQMSPEAAKRLLDAQKGDEQFLQLKPQGKPQDNQRPLKDW
jgi:Ca-activated chloride channel family protein